MRTVERPPFEILYHWSPAERRTQIERRGLRPGSLSINRAWRPPFVCLAPNPKLAIEMAIQQAEYVGVEIAEWDLWMVYMDTLDRWELLFDDRDDTVKEVRVYDPIPRSEVHWLARRSS